MLKSLVEKEFTVSVIGAAGGIGQPLSLLLKNDASIKQLRLYDIVDVKGIATDLSHCDTPAELISYAPEHIKECLYKTDIIVIPAGVPRKPGMTRDQLFEVNASSMANIITQIAEFAPEAFILLITNPVNSLVPLASEILKKHGVYNPQKLMGITKLDGVRAGTFFSEIFGVNPKQLVVPVIGGHAGETIVPLFSQTHLPEIYGAPHKTVNVHKLTKEDRTALIHRVQFGGDEVVNAKHGTGSATLGMAYAAAAFTDKLIRGLEGETEVNDIAFVESDLGYARFFASRVNFGLYGINKILPIGKITDYEEEMIRKMLPTLESQIDKGIEFGKSYKPTQ